MNPSEVIMETRERFLSCTYEEDTYPVEVEKEQDKEKEDVSDKNSSKNKGRPLFRKANKPKQKTLCTQLLMQRATNAVKGGSMIEARHSYINTTATSDENKNKDSNEIVEVEPEGKKAKD